MTPGALRLQKVGLIRYSRGRIAVAVLDRDGLEQRSYECDEVVRRNTGGFCRPRVAT